MKNKGKTHDAIIEAAFSLIASNGLENTSLSMIATEVGISKPAIYYYFSSKEQLIDYLFNFVFTDYYFSAYFSISEYTRDNFEKRLVNDGIRLFKEYEENSAALRVVQEFILSAARNQKYEQKLKSILQDFLEGFESLLAHGITLGVVSPNKAEANAHILALVADNISCFMMMGIKANYNQIWETAVSNVMKGTR